MLQELILGTFLEPMFKRLSVAVRRHVFPSLGITVILTLSALFLLLNPWFGSQWVKYKVVTFMVGGADDVEYVLKKAQDNKKLASSLTAGAARAGFFTSSDRNIVMRWSDQFSDGNVVDQKKLGKDYAAILAARARAETHEPPFQPIGLEAMASSPSCQQTRPTLGQIMVRANSYLATKLKSGDFLKLIRKDNLGRPVVGTVNLAPNMPADTDIYLNRVQMIDFLAATSPNIAVRAIVTDELPNQNSDDHYPSDVRISCAHG